jgi:hypothetical protein
MSDPLLDKVRERIEAAVTTELGQTHYPDLLDALSRVVEVALALARREGYHYRAGFGAYRGEFVEESMKAVAYPIPTRTREVLREEPVPGTNRPIYRWHDGRLESSGDGVCYGPAPVGCRDAALMRHALDLHDRPTRTEEIPADESDPWGERAK